MCNKCSKWWCNFRATLYKGNNQNKSIYKYFDKYTNIFKYNIISILPNSGQIQKKKEYKLNS